MIQYIALAFALDSENKANDANKSATEALNNSRQNMNDKFITIKPFDLIDMIVLSRS
jgi:hypothetical protein